MKIKGRIAPLLEKAITPEIDMLIDSGAECSIISKQVFDKWLTTEVHTRPAKVKLHSVSGQPLRCFGKCDVEIIYDDYRMVHSFMIVEVQELVILGLDFLQAYQASWDWKNNGLDFNKGRSNKDSEISSTAK